MNINIVSTDPHIEQWIIILIKQDGTSISTETVTGTGIHSITESETEPYTALSIPVIGSVRQSAHAYSLNDRMFLADTQTKPYWYVCSAAGTTDAAEPTPFEVDGTTPKTTITETGGVVWTLLGKIPEPQVVYPVPSSF